MSQLSPFVRVFRTLSTQVDLAARRCLAEARTEGERPEPNLSQINFAVAKTLNELSTALAASAIDLEQAIAADLARVGPGAKR